MSDTPPERPPFVLEAIENGPQEPYYFPVSLLKLSLMSLCSFGLYQAYWAFKHWALIRSRGKPVSPVLRSGMGSLFSYFLFRQIRRTALQKGIPFRLPASGLACGLILFTHSYWITDPYWVTYNYPLFCALSFLFLLPVQATANRINRKMAPEADKNDRFSRWNLLVLIPGGICFGLALWAMLAPAARAQ